MSRTLEIKLRNDARTRTKYKFRRKSRYINTPSKRKLSKSEAVWRNKLVIIAGCIEILSLITTFSIIYELKLTK